MRCSGNQWQRQVLKQAIDEFQPHLLICASKGGAYATGLWKAGLWDGPTLLINRPGCFEFL